MVKSLCVVYVAPIGSYCNIILPSAYIPAETAFLSSIVPLFIVIFLEMAFD